MSENFNELSPAETERLALLAEEAGEIAQVVGKILRHGYDRQSTHPPLQPTNRQLLTSELGDFRCALAMMERAGDVNAMQIYDAAYDKRCRIARWLHHNTSPDITKREQATEEGKAPSQDSSAIPQMGHVKDAEVKRYEPTIRTSYDSESLEPNERAEMTFRPDDGRWVTLAAYTALRAELSAARAEVEEWKAVAAVWERHKDVLGAFVQEIAEMKPPPAKALFLAELERRLALASLEGGQQKDSRQAGK